MIAAKYRHARKRRRQSRGHAGRDPARQPRERTSCRARQRRDSTAAMDRLSAPPSRAYRGLVYETDGFPTFFRQMTPIAEIADSQDRLAPGQPHQVRPDRGSARHPLGVQLGAGAGDAARLVRRRHRRSPRLATSAMLREMREAWPFFRTTLDNLEMVLAKSDMAHRRAAMPSWSRTRRCARRLQPHPRRLAAHPRLPAGDHRPEPAARAQSASSTPRSACACPISSRSTCSRSSCSGATAPARRTHGRRRHPALHQRDRDGAAEFGLTMFVGDDGLPLLPEPFDAQLDHVSRP